MNAPAPGPVVSDDDLWTILSQVWESLLLSEIHPAPAVNGTSAEQVPDDATAADAPGTLTAQVLLTGGWVGAVTLRAPRPAVERMAATMFAVPDGATLTTADVEDAFGELANVVGGGVKSLLPGPSTLSLPGVSDGPVPAVGPCVQQVRVAWAGYDVRVRIEDGTTGGPADQETARQEHPS